MIKDMLNVDLRERILKIRALVCDVDGVLTDRKLYIPEGDDLLRCFDVQDGYGMRMWIKTGRESVLLSGARSSVIKKRAEMLGINHLYLANENKLEGYSDFLEKMRMKDEEVCYMADDLFDLSVFQRVGLAVSVADGHATVRRIAHWVTRACGGMGAIREVVDAVLYVQGAHPYQKVLEPADILPDFLM